VITTKITRIVEERRVEAEVTGSVVAALFGLDGFRVLAAADAGSELELLVETLAGVVPCPECGAVAQAKDRRAVWVRDLPIGGRPVVVCWHKRVWRCRHTLCPKKTWTEQHPAIQPRACLTERARAWAFAQVGARDGAVSRVAYVLGVGRATIMRIATTRAEPIIDDPARLDAPTAIGVDETAFLRGTGQPRRCMPPTSPT
jgi:transposase